MKLGLMREQFQVDDWLAPGSGFGCDTCGAVWAVVTALCGGVVSAGAGCWAPSKVAADSESSVTARKRIGVEIVSQRGRGCRVRAVKHRRGKLFEIQLSRFLQINNCVLKSPALADNADLGTFGNVPRFFPVHHGGVSLNRHNQYHHKTRRSPYKAPSCLNQRQNNQLRLAFSEENRSEAPKSASRGSESLHGEAQD